MAGARELSARSHDASATAAHGHGHAHDHNHGHSHSHADHIASSTKEGLRVVAIATAGMFVVAAIELGVFALSGSAGLLSDALHNLGDVLTTAALWLAFILAPRPPT